MEKIPEVEQENEVEKNPNSVGELISMGTDLPTYPDKAYRSVKTKEAIDDIENSGIVRNRQSAGVVKKSRWGERVFWSRGKEGKFHPIFQGTFVIEAPLSVVEERVVTKEDITAIYTKNGNEEVVDIINKENEEKTEQESLEERKMRDTQKLAEIRKSLGISE